MSLKARKKSLARQVEPLTQVTNSIEEHTPQFFTLKKGASLYRIATEEYAPVSLNPHIYADSPDYDPILHGRRFSPFRARNGRWVMSSYVGKTENVAVGETLLRDMPLGVKYWSINMDKIKDLWMFKLRTVEELKFVKLRGLQLRSMGLTNVNLIGLPPQAYKFTQAFAKALYEHKVVKNEKAAGLLWTSRHVDDAFCCMPWSRNLSKNWACMEDCWELDAAPNRPKLEDILSKANIVLA
jgi:hypothetical protein